MLFEGETARREAVQLHPFPPASSREPLGFHLALGPVSAPAGPAEACRECSSALSRVAPGSPFLGQVHLAEVRGLVPSEHQGHSTLFWRSPFTFFLSTFC